MTGVLCPPNSSTKFRDLPADQQIGGYPAPGQLSDAVDEQTLDSEGRCVILEFPAFVLIGLYSPATRDETRTEFREAYIDAIDARVRNLVAMGKQVFLCGDLNIVRSEMDTAGLAERLRKEGMTLDDFLSTPSRRFLNHLVFGGHVDGERDGGGEEPVLWDLCREFHPNRAGMFTCWETRKNARPGNFGSRIDYVLCSSAIKDWFVDSNIQEGLLGSDHCPVYATIGDVVSLDGTNLPIEDVMNPPGMFKGGQRQREWSPKDHLPMSAKLIPEFDRRQSIRDMFFKKAAPSAKGNATTGPTSKPDSPTATKAPAAAHTGPDEFHQDSMAPMSPTRTTATVTESKTASSGDTSTSPQRPLAAKRQAEPSTPQTRPLKKGKVALSRENSTKPAPGKSQSSLKGFFKPKMPIRDPDSANEPEDTAASTPKPETKPSKRTSTQDSPPNQPNNGSATEPRPDTEDKSTEKVFDPIVAKESWSKLLGKRVLPKCEHGEDCQMLVTKKAGINCGMYCVFFLVYMFGSPGVLGLSRLLLSLSVSPKSVLSVCGTALPPSPLSIPFLGLQHYLGFSPRLPLCLSLVPNGIFCALGTVTGPPLVVHPPSRSSATFLFPIHCLILAHPVCSFSPSLISSPPRPLPCLCPS